MQSFAERVRRFSVSARAAALALACITLSACATATVQPPADPPRTGPESGTLFIAGGGSLDSLLVRRFVELAGGADAHIVVIPTAGVEDSFPASWPGLRLFENSGARRVTVLHTRSRQEADTETFAAPLRSATGIWLSGGRQWRITDAYLGTLTQRGIEAVLERGGVVGGTSAGASVQASYMVRGAPQSNAIMMAPGRDTGFGFLRNAAVDQHLTARGRQDDMLEVIARHPHLLGIGIDEGTAIIVTGDTARIEGRGRAAFYNAADRGDMPYYFLRTGDTFDLGARITLRGARIPPETIADEAAVLRVVNGLFDAMRTRDTAAIRSMMHERIRILVPSERDGATQVRVSSVDDFVRQIAASPDRLDERAIDPVVRVDGPLAMVWTYYDFLRGADFSHCGTDSFHLHRTARGWIITALSYTIRRDDCTR